jgi:uncharacterized protein YdhG (YjbR/CyaY superfamily)
VKRVRRTLVCRVWIKGYRHFQRQFGNARHFGLWFLALGLRQNRNVGQPQQKNLRPKTKGVLIESMTMKTKPPKTIDEYLSTVSDEHRVALERLRKQIQAAAPKAFFQNGGLVWFAAAKNHCSFFPGGRAVEMHQSELKNYSLSKGTIRFQPDKPLPATLVRRIVKERIAANEMKAARKRK